MDLTAERVIWIQKISIQLWITNERSNLSDDDCHVLPSKQTELFQSQVVVCADLKKWHCIKFACSQVSHSISSIVIVSLEFNELMNNE